MGFPIVAVLRNLPIDEVGGVVVFWGSVELLVIGNLLLVISELLLTDN
jgi:hypothetical protein